MRVVSTANVPPQQRSWWLEENGNDHPGEIPGGLMSVEEAKEYRLKLMSERSRNQKSVELQWAKNTYSFCEH